MKKKITFWCCVSLMIFGILIISVEKTHASQELCEEKLYTSIDCVTSDKVCYFTLHETGEKCVFDDYTFKYLSGDTNSDY